ncbi:MAG: hypothetical protein HN976_36725 [Lentisphaerae bacterium]|nr:hypothetical protein [Lentisphaerota bacterium]MBT7060696.1 hypothetical protein [Lentisphaerota bacterium]
MDRPYLSHSTKSIAEEAEANWHEADALGTIAEELEHRIRPGAKELLARVKERLRELDSDPGMPEKLVLPTLRKADQASDRKGRSSISPKLRLVTGSIFEPSLLGLDSLVLWLPCGMTSIRCEWQDFSEKLKGHLHSPWSGSLQPVVLPHAMDGASAENAHQFHFCKVDPPVDGLRYIHVDLNLGHRIEDIDDIPSMVDTALGAVVQEGMRRIGMNAIRTHADARQSERCLICCVSEWLMRHAASVDEISLIDKRGGFVRFH